MKRETLNIKVDNTIAISCYKKIGFEIVSSYRNER
jgi:predicted GNAT family acetyltransferase